IVRRQIERRIARLEARGTPAALDRAELLRLDLEQQELATLGATREVEALLAIFRQFPHGFTRHELNEAEAEYWQRRLWRQAGQDLAAGGRVGVGNQEALRQIGQPLPYSADHIGAVEQRFLECGDVRIVVVVPTLIPEPQVRAQGLRCLEGWEIPGAFRQLVHVVSGRPVAAAYNAGVSWALAQRADFILCVEDDHLIPAGGFDRLWRLVTERGERVIAGGWYPQKRQPRTGAPIVLREGRREYLEDDGAVHEVYAVPQGFTLIPARAFFEIPQPWFVTTDSLTQDAFFSQLAREAGYTLLVDTGLRCGHVDRETGTVYE
ncbi:MAG: hypothetical protein ACKV0T_27605, partial [Planctomycetales bacterium]